MLCKYDPHATFQLLDSDLAAFVTGGVSGTELATAGSISGDNNLCSNLACLKDGACLNGSCVTVNAYCNRNIACLQVACIL